MANFPTDLYIPSTNWFTSKEANSGIFKDINTETKYSIVDFIQQKITDGDIILPATTDNNGIFSYSNQGAELEGGTRNIHNVDALRFYLDDGFSTVKTLITHNAAFNTLGIYGPDVAGGGLTKSILLEVGNFFGSNYSRLTADFDFDMVITGTLDLKPTVALTINSAYSLPLTDGTAGQVLQTDGSGNLTWVTL